MTSCFSYSGVGGGVGVSGRGGRSSWEVVGGGDVMGGVSWSLRVDPRDGVRLLDLGSVLGRKGGREGGREGGRKGGREDGREEGRGGERNRYLRRFLVPH